LGRWIGLSAGKVRSEVALPFLRGGVDGRHDEDVSMDRIEKLVVGGDRQLHRGAIVDAIAPARHDDDIGVSGRNLIDHSGAIGSTVIPMEVAWIARRVGVVRAIEVPAWHHCMARPRPIVGDIRVLDGPLLKVYVRIARLAGPFSREKIDPLHRLLVPARVGQKRAIMIIGAENRFKDSSTTSLPV
jgi:hypothetical protein